MRGSREPRADHELRPIVKQGSRDGLARSANGDTTGKIQLRCVEAVRLAALAPVRLRAPPRRSRFFRERGIRPTCATAVGCAAGPAASLPKGDNAASIKARVAVSPKRPQTIHYRGKGEFMISGGTITCRRRYKFHVGRSSLTFQPPLGAFYGVTTLSWFPDSKRLMVEEADSGENVRSR